MKSDDAQYKKNLKLFEKFGSRYLSRVEEADCQSYQFSTTEKGELNLYNQSEDYYYHSNRGAIEEAIHSFQEKENIEQTQVLFVFGIGLGYFYDAAQKWLKGRKNRYLVFFEDNFCVIRKFLETEKATTILSDPQVMLYPIEIKDEENWGELPHEFRQCGKMFAFTPSQSAQLRVYQKRREKITNLIRLKLHLVFEEEISSLKLMDEFSQELVFNNFYSTLRLLSGSYLGQTLKDQFKDIPAMICGAGPSIGNILDTIGSIKDNCLLFGAGTGMNVLNKNGILPHFGGALDPYDTSLSRIMTNTAFEVPYCYTHRFHHEAFTYIHGTKILFRTTPFFEVETWFNQQLGIEDNVEVPARVSTTNYCLFLAREMGCNPIVLAGIDMAYTDSSRYPDEVKGHPLDESQVTSEIENLPYETGKLIPIKNKEGKQILTRWDWLAESNTYREFHQTNPDINLLNVSQGGLEIEDIPNPTIEEFKDQYLEKTYDLMNQVHATIHQEGTIDVSFQQIQEVLNRWKESLQFCGERFVSIIDALKEVQGEALSSNKIPEEVLTEELEKLISEVKEQPAYKHYLSYMAEMFRAITSLDMHRLRTFPETYSDKERFFKEHEYEDAKAKFLLSGANLHIKLVEKALKIKTAEGGPPAHPSPRNPNEIYQEKQGRMIIKDPEMGLDVDVNVDDLNKPSQFFSKKGELLAEGWFLNGKRTGKNWQYYHSGALFSIQRFKGGVLEGDQQYYYEDGTDKTMLHYKSGLLHGTVILYYPNGRKHREITFTNGEIDGAERMWNEEGVLISETEYKMGEPTGRSRKWHSNGQLAKEIVYYGSPEKFDLTEWDREGILVIQQTYFPEILGEEVLQDSAERKESIARIQKQLNELRNKK